ncbi:MAG: hypothetical protein KGJ06_08535 [Pseudomonadota bacterium]|nr:hypothetical protein [Pseudomonadota bacterium]
MQKHAYEAKSREAAKSASAALAKLDQSATAFANAPTLANMAAFSLHIRPAWDKVYDYYLCNGGEDTIEKGVAAIQHVQPQENERKNFDLYQENIMIRLEFTNLLITKGSDAVMARQRELLRRPQWPLERV